MRVSYEGGQVEALIHRPSERGTVPADSFEQGNVSDILRTIYVTYGRPLPEIPYQT
ncbi:hypothetical protein FB559_6285 [Actinoallomurus bryophytorum]|uniref:Uncharacterized protein n=1 Tax=Actinoallomurus bryophytorum TaxID=1490222 RepID=A0A543CTY6_9ACTN|nr:hypothetical protein FB559_6285 [Actinoallomurus bryophytorum]